MKSEYLRKGYSENYCDFKLDWILADPVEAIWGSVSSPESLSKQSSVLNLLPHQTHIQIYPFLG